MGQSPYYLVWHSSLITFHFSGDTTATFATLQFRAQIGSRWINNEKKAGHDDDWFNKSFLDYNTGDGNTANGSGALYSNTTGNSNTATGLAALYSNTTASENTATGYEALTSNTTGFDNTASGLNALYSNTTGNFNAANGAYALYSNTTGIQNTGSGYSALYGNTTGRSNIALGFQAGQNLTRGVITLTSATLVLHVTPGASASAQPEPRRTPLSPALVGQRFQVA